MRVGLASLHFLSAGSEDLEVIECPSSGQAPVCWQTSVQKTGVSPEETSNISVFNIRTQPKANFPPLLSLLLVLPLYSTSTVAFSSCLHRDLSHYMTPFLILGPAFVSGSPLQYTGRCPSSFPTENAPLTVGRFWKASNGNSLGLAKEDAFVRGGFPLFREEDQSC
ncbi:hypothetical protein CDAR_382951 [Caerostris darwini]|uniref:Uncharacterized protein n=1 Tax=Caerostris darwini TaxID=1538125 RepID=A0AAV4SS01_9ARAC|nr:hypothetical protein CDAR_382951 [Caerostris darwini]